MGKNMEPNNIENAENKFIHVDGVSTHYYEAGSGDPLILIHGGGAGADAWGNWRGSIADFASNFHVFAIDMIGFGFTDKPSPDNYQYSQNGRVEHVSALIKALGLSNVNLIGNSMGGITSMGVAIEHPELINKIVLMGSAGIKAPLSEELMSIMNYDYTPAGMEKIVRGLTNPNFDVNEEIVNYRHQLSTQDDTRAAYDAVMGWIKDQHGLYYEEDYIAKVSQPTLVVNGKLDKVVQLDCAYKLLELIENSTGYILPDCGHWAMIEHPEKFAQVAISFLMGN
jgi:2-hydroxy-6-oxo-6-(2'-aminophenyl)hexa-2,4-dienoate hydrolase